MIRVLFFSHAKSIAGRPEISLPPEDARDVAALWSSLIELFPEFTTIRDSSRVARNCEFANVGDRFSDGDEIAIIPPVSGG